MHKELKIPNSQNVEKKGKSSETPPKGRVWGCVINKLLIFSGKSNSQLGHSIDLHNIEQLSMMKFNHRSRTCDPSGMGAEESGEAMSI